MRVAQDCLALNTSSLALPVFHLSLLVVKNDLIKIRKLFKNCVMASRSFLIIRIVLTHHF